MGFSAKHRGPFMHADLILDRNNKTIYLQSWQMFQNTLQISFWDVSITLYFDNEPTQFL